MTIKTEIKYEELVDQYQNSLTNVLRGFKSAEDYSFLETWVPDDDDCMSIFNVLECAKDEGLSQIAVEIGPRTTQKLDKDRLVQQASRLGQANLDSNNTLWKLNVQFNSLEK